MFKQKEEIIINKLFRSSVTSIILSAVAAMFGMLIDGIVIGKFLGTDCMAAYGIVTPLFSIIAAISGVMAAGAQVFCAKHLGAGEVKRASEVFSVCVGTTIVIALVVTGIVLGFAGPICTIMGAKGQTAGLLPLAVSYLYGISPGILPVLLLFVFNSLLRLDGDPNRVVVAVAVMTVFDIAGDLINVLLVHGGMLGMGISTAISYYAALIILLLHFKKPDIIFHFRIKDMHLMDLFGILTTGAPTAVASVSTMIRNMILNIIMAGAAGSVAVAALSVRTTLNTLFGSIIMGVGMTATMIAGMIHGEEDRTGAKQLLKTSLKWGVGLGILLGVLVFAAAPLFVSLFAGKSEDAVQMAELAVRALRIYAFGLPLYGINMVMVDYLQGISERLLANLLSVLDNLICVIAVALALTPALGSTAVWLSYPIGEAIVIVIIFAIAAMKKKKMPNKVEDYLFLPESFGVADEDIYECSMYSIDDVMKAVIEIGDFMKEHHAPEKEQMMLPLFAEEMCKNVIQHGFTKDNKPHSVELRVLQKNDDWILRIRDNCVAFDPKKRVELHHPEDPTAHIGIRMVYGMAKDIQYVNAMQLNNLTIRV